MCAGGHGIYKDSIDYSVFSGDWLIGRIYERKGFPDDPACGTPRIMSCSGGTEAAMAVERAFRYVENAPVRGRIFCGKPEVHFSGECSNRDYSRSLRKRMRRGAMNPE